MNRRTQRRYLLMRPVFEKIKDKCAPDPPPESKAPLEPKTTEAEVPVVPAPPPVKD